MDKYYCINALTKLLRAPVLILGISIMPVNLSYAQDKGLLKQLSNHMQYLTERDMVLSKNIANSDTPKYLPKDVKKNQSHSPIALKRTNSKHLSLDDNLKNEMVNSEILEMKMNGNGVTLDHELMKKNENSSELQQTSNIYGKAKQMLKTALGGNK